MPSFANPYSDVDAFSGAANAFANSVYQVPMMRRQQAMELLRLHMLQQQMQQQAQMESNRLAIDKERWQGEGPLRQAQAGEATARTKELETRTKKTEQELSDSALQRTLATQLQGAVRQQAMPSGMAPYDVPTKEQVGQVGLADIRSIAAALEALAGKPINNVTAGSTEAVGGIPLYTAPQALKPGEIVSATKGLPPVAKPPGLSPDESLLRGLGPAMLGLEGRLSETATPMSPLAQKVQSLLDFITSGKLGAQKPQGGTTGTPGRVRVKAPNGQVGNIPQEQLQEALQQGYSEVK